MQLAFIEDSDEDFALFQRVFKQCGSLIRWSSGEAALTAFRGGGVDLRGIDALLVDLNLPGMDGVQLIESARALPGGSVPLVCVLSSSQSAADIARATRAGADGYLVKPEDVAGLRGLPRQLAAMAELR
jgi:CheY-like chemotaxis protein